MAGRSLGLAGAALACGLAAVAASPAHATVVATIVGAYDKDGYDTPELDITNSSGGTFINAQMVLTGYQGLNNGTTETVDLSGYGWGNGTTTDVVWGSIPGAPAGTSAGNLSAYDYDDEWGNTPSGYTNPNCVVGGTLCSLVGNFSVKFTATISGGPHNGQPVISVFSPTHNFTGGFVGWEGLDSTGLSETTFDDHSGTFGGTMAVIVLGTTVPEPAAWTAMLVGFGALGAMTRSRRRSALAA